MNSEVRELIKDSNEPTSPKLAEAESALKQTCQRRKNLLTKGYYKVRTSQEKVDPILLK